MTISASDNLVPRIRRLSALLLVVGAASGCGSTDDPAPPTSAKEPDAQGTLTDAALPVRRYVDAVNDGQLDALVAAFHRDGRVIDVGREIVGQDAIREWARNEVIGGRLTVEAVRDTARGTLLIVRFAPGGTGGFRASYDFAVDGNRIRQATLRYA